jgi:hypothetical protein
LEHLLFAAYLILFAWLVTKIPFFRKSGLTAPQLIIVFLLKVMAGIFYGWIGVYYGNLAKMVDTWKFHYDSIEAYDLLLKSPALFFESLFANNYAHGYGNFLSSENSWWNDLHNNAFTMLLSFFNLFSFGNYYINVILYSFISIFGAIGIYRVMMEEFPTKQAAVFLSTFLLPSFIYWTSGIHKDGIVFAGFVLIIYNIYFGFRNKSFDWSKGLLILLGLLIILVVRNYLLVIILPALAAWYISEKVKKINPALIFLSIYLFTSIVFFTARYIHPKLDFPAAVANKQQDFLKLRGGSAVPVTELEPNFISFIKNTPEALVLSTVRPFPSDVKHLLSLAAAVEIVFLFLCFLLFLLWRTNDKLISPFLLFCLFFSFSVLLTIGYTVNFLGAIVRYRSIVLPFLVVPMMALINWRKIASIVSR